MAHEADIILVATHPRSGTHLCINSLCLNTRDVLFSLLRGQYPTLERLLLDHDEAYTREFGTYLEPKDGIVRVVKTHLRPSEIRVAMDNPAFLSKRDHAILCSIMERARFVHVYRDGRDTMVSWFYYMTQFAGGLPSDLLPRLQAMAFAEFLRMPNKYYPPIRGFQPEDENRPRYWAAHVNEWMAHEGAIPVAFESLRADPENAVRGLARELNLSDRLVEPIRKPALIPPARGGLPSRAYRALQRRGVALYHRYARGVTHYPPSPAFARKGASGDWQSCFSEEDLKYFMEQAGDTLVRLGYQAR